MQQLPHKLSELARIALDDVVAVEQRPGFRIDMSVFVNPFDSVCLCCVAGAVMIQRLLDAPVRVPVGEFAAVFGHDNARALFAIEYLRTGCVGAALAVLEGRAEWGDAIEDNDHALDRELPQYSGSDPAWHEAMVLLIDDLEEAGL